MLITILCVMMLEKKKSFIQTVHPIIKEKAHIHTYILNKL